MKSSKRCVSFLSLIFLLKFILEAIVLVNDSVNVFVREKKIIFKFIGLIDTCKLIPQCVYLLYIDINKCPGVFVRRSQTSAPEYLLDTSKLISQCIRLDTGKLMPQCILLHTMANLCPSVFVRHRQINAPVYQVRHRQIYHKISCEH